MVHQPPSAHANADPPARLCVMLSGSGRTLLNLLDSIDSGVLRARVVQVIASRECLGAERARARSLPTLVEPGVISASRLLDILTIARADWIVLAGYLKKVNIPAAFDNRCVNIHPALLPSFGGHGMYGGRVHRAVLNAGCKVSGCTVHLCDGHYDRGPIVLQRTCEVLECDDEHTLADRVFALECKAYPEALQLLIDGRVVVEDGARAGGEGGRSGGGGGRARVLPPRT